MAFQSLVSGSECSVATNPLAQVLKHTEGDRSLQQDRISGPSSSSLRQLPGASNSASEHDLALARQFFDANHQEQRSFVANPPALLSHPQTVNYTAVQHGIYPAKTRDFQSAWQLEQQVLTPAPSQASWASEFNNFGTLRNGSPSGQQQKVHVQDEAHRPLYLSNTYNSMSPAGMYNAGWPGLYTSTNLDMGIQGKGKGKSREIDFEAAFDQVTASLASTQLNTSRIEEVKENDDVAGEGKFDLDQYLSRIEQNSSSDPSLEDAAKWEAEINQLMSAQRDELDYGASMQEAWENGIGDFSNDTQLPSTFIRFDDEGLPILDDYVFEKDNKYLDPSASSSTSPLFQNAKALLDANGSLSEAALMLEAAIQKGEGGYEAWILLGDVRTMDEREDAGMRALMHGMGLAEAAGIPGPGMLSLAIAFTNESYNRASHIMLLRWLRATYPEHPIPEDAMQALQTHSTWDTHPRMTDLFISLARTQHSRGAVDADVQVALGVLYYSNGEYDRAKDCFETALSVRPKDYLLWNRLGSALSNGNAPEESLGAYREALNLRPTYTRAIYNVGVACLNIGAHQESAEHFLSALSLQKATNGDTSDQLWHILRRVLEVMGRTDLVEVAKAKGSLDVFRRDGFDF
ncbi:hypothetical protein JOM56_002044 [Amanita muscaria]